MGFVSGNIQVERVVTKKIAFDTQQIMILY